MFEELKKRTLDANLKLVEYGLVVLTWGNVSLADRSAGVFAIKPSGVSYNSMKAEDMVVLDFCGNVVEGSLNPSSDTPTHLVLYQSFESISSVVHTHSSFACSWAQAGRSIPPYGTTHADFCNGEIPCVRGLLEEEVVSNYEFNTGKVIAEHFKKNQIDPSHCPGALVKRHGPFAWGKDEIQSVQNALILEEVAKMAFQTEQLAMSANQAELIENYILKKHFERKHGKNAYYGQKTKD